MSYTKSLDIKDIDEKAEIADSVCSFLNDAGGKVYCFNKGYPFQKNEEAVAAGKAILQYLRKNISDFPNRNVRISLTGKKNRFVVIVKVKKSDSVHVLNIPKPEVKNVSLKEKVFDKEYLGILGIEVLIGGFPDNLEDYLIQKEKEERAKKSFDQWKNSLDQQIRELEKQIRISQLLFPPEIKSIEKHADGYYKVGGFAGGNKYYKYLSLENVLQGFLGSNIWFVEPAKWKDKFENYFYGATIDGESCSDNNPLLYATCVTNKRDSESAWKIYSYNTQGLASRCVEIIIDRKKFREQLLKAKVKEAKDKRYKPLLKYFDIYEGVVRYKDEQSILELSKPELKGNKKNQAFDTYFNPFSFEKYLNLMLIKRNAFQHESETRVFIIPKNKKGYSKGVSHLDVKYEWGEFVEGIRYDCHCSDLEIVLLKDAIRKILKLKKNQPLPQGFKFEPYDVYKGPESPTISTQTVNTD